MWIFPYFDLILECAREHDPPGRQEKPEVDIPKIPNDTALVHFNPLFANMFDAVLKGKGMTNRQIIQGKNMTIANLLAQTFPRIKCFDNAETPFISPSTVAYIHAISIACISLQNEDSINARALQP
jgi:hypothetical protein